MAMALGQDRSTDGDGELLIEEMLEEAERLYLDGAEVNDEVANDLRDVGRHFLNQARAPVTHDICAVLQASQIGDVLLLRKALDNLNCSINRADVDGDTALHLACLHGHLACVQVLLERGASLDSKDEDGATSLHDACSGGFTEVVQALLDAAENQDHVKRLLDTTDIDGETPLHCAARGEHLGVVQLLLKAGASPNKKNILRKIPADLVDPDTEVKLVLDAATPVINILKEKVASMDV